MFNITTTTKPTRLARVVGRVVATNASFTVMLLYLVGIQKAASVGSVSPTVPTQMARPTVTGEIPVASAMGPTMDTVVSMATVADPTAARMIIPSTKARRITGMFTLENSSTRLIFLGDVIYCPIPLIGGFASIGDILLAAGVFFCLLAVMKPIKLPRWMVLG